MAITAITRYATRLKRRAILSEAFAFPRKGQREHDFSCWRVLRPPLDAVLARATAYEQLRIRFYIHQNFPGDDFGVSKNKVMHACLNKLQYLIVRRIGALAVLEYHYSDTNAFAPIHYIIRSKSVRFPQYLTDAALGAAGGIRNRMNLGVLSNVHVHEATTRFNSNPRIKAYRATAGLGPSSKMRQKDDLTVRRKVGAQRGWS